MLVVVTEAHVVIERDCRACGSADPVVTVTDTHVITKCRGCGREWAVPR